MSDFTPLIPRQPVPDLSLSLVGGGDWRLSEQRSQNFTLIVVYRGLHCPICSKYLAGLEQMLPDFDKRGVGVIATSTDTRERAEQAKADWDVTNLKIGHGFSLETARRWGLFISTSRGLTSVGIEEPALFSEPGVFLVRADGTLYFSSVQTMPFARPAFDQILSAIDFVLAKDYPARGQVTDLTAAEAAE